MKCKCFQEVSYLQKKALKIVNNHKQKISFRLYTAQPLR